MKGWACSSVRRLPASHTGGPGFDPLQQSQRWRAVQRGWRQENQIAFVISQGSLSSFSVVSKMSARIPKLKDYLFTFSSAGSFLLPHVDLSLLLP